MADKTEELCNFIASNIYDGIQETLRARLPHDADDAIESGVTDGIIIAAVLMAAVGFSAKLTGKAGGSFTSLASLLREYADTLEKDPTAVIPNSDVAASN